VWRLFYDTVKGGDFRSREANVYRLAQISTAIIDQCAAQGVPFAREYGGTLANRSFGGAQVSRTFYARGQTGQQLLLGAYQALSRQIHAGKVAMYPRTEMLDLIVAGGHAKGSNATAIWRAHRRGAAFANPCFTQIHPTCIPVTGEHQAKLTLMSESLRNDGRVWVPKTRGDARAPAAIPEAERDYFLERRYPSFGNLVPRDIASRAAKDVCDAGLGVGPGGYGVYLDLADALGRLGRRALVERYGNLFEMYQRITDEDPLAVPMRIYPAPHYTMGGLWVDYALMSTIPGLFVLGEANFSDHGANRLGASALMQGLADGYFVAPPAVGDYLAGAKLAAVDARHAAFTDAEAEAGRRLDGLLAARGRRTADDFHRELGKLMWDACGMSRAAGGLRAALDRLPALREEFARDVAVPGGGRELNQALERAGRVSDFLELAELMCRDALARDESCGSHFRVEHQTSEGDARRDDARFAHVAVWEHAGAGEPPRRHEEPLTVTEVAPSRRSYQ
ncbi:MAG TPA: succinate dehydrogenase (quinone) flavoprotein subunit, partial [Burkholderiales bacterium]